MTCIVVIALLVDAVQGPRAFHGAWTLNRELSSPVTTGSTADEPVVHIPERADGDSPRPGRRVAGTAVAARRVAEERAARIAAARLLAELLQPSVTLRIVETATAIQIETAAGHSRQFRTNGKSQKTQLLSGTVTTTTKWDGRAIVQQFRIPDGPTVRVRYTVEQGRLRIAVDPPARFAGHQKLSWIYERTPNDMR